MFEVAPLPPRHQPPALNHNSTGVAQRGAAAHTALAPPPIICAVASDSESVEWSDREWAGPWRKEVARSSYCVTGHAVEIPLEEGDK
jgi:hypothetical protein